MAKQEITDETTAAAAVIRAATGHPVGTSLHLAGLCSPSDRQKLAGLPTRKGGERFDLVVRMILDPHVRKIQAKAAEAEKAARLAATASAATGDTKPAE